MSSIVYNEVSHNSKWVSSQTWQAFYAFAKEHHYKYYKPEVQQKALKRVYELCCEKHGVAAVFEEKKQEETKETAKK